MKYYDFKGDRIGFKKATYVNPACLAILAETEEGEPYGTITVNLPQHVEMAENESFVDVNNYPYIKEFLEENGIAEYTGLFQRSGFVMYPMMRFSMEFLDSIEELG